MDSQLEAASVQTADPGGQAITFWSLWWNAASWRVALLSYATLSHFYIFLLLNIDQCFFFDFFLCLFLSFVCVCSIIY